MGFTFVVCDLVPAYRSSFHLGHSTPLTHYVVEGISGKGQGDHCHGFLSKWSGLLLVWVEILMDLFHAVTVLMEG
jgi:hypothetical protein